MKPAHLIILLLMNFCWAGVYSAYKVMGHDLTTGGIVTIRFGLAGLLMLLAWPLYPGAAPRGRAAARGDHDHGRRDQSPETSTGHAASSSCRVARSEPSGGRPGAGFSAICRSMIPSLSSCAVRRRAMLG